MTVLDIGCGPGFFTIDMAQMVGKSGRVIASDVQEGMLEKLKHKIEGTELADRIQLHKSEKTRIRLSEPVDFVLAFYVVHEIPNKLDFFSELASIMQPGGQILFVEPPFHVSKSAFAETVRTAQEAGFQSEKGPKVLFSKAVILKK